MTDQRPSFLEGTFFWDTRGYHYASKPNLKLTTAAALADANPWIKLAAILEHAKQNNHAPASQLLSEFQQADYQILSVSAELFGDVASDSDLEKLLPMVSSQQSDLTLTAIARSLYTAGRLRHVPIILHIWNLVTLRDDRDLISCWLSDLLESEPGPIIANESYTPEKYSQIVQDIYSDACDNVGTDLVSVWEGQIFSVQSVAQRMYDIVFDENASLSDYEDMLIDYRHKFEAATGTDCTRFFEGEEIQPQNISEVLTLFLESDQGAAFEPGHRYFFGHRIPT